MADPAVYRGMTRATLDAAYNNMAAVADSAAKLAEWTERSTALKERANARLLDLPYGPRPRQRIDLFTCGAARAPLLVFVHGGYWQRNSKDVFACMAEGPLGHGIDVALVGYTLAPDIRLSGIVAEIAEAIRWLRREGPALGVARDRLVVSGWSAGGHLAATAMGIGGVDAGLSISGIFDLEPCRLNYLNDKLLLDEAEASALSPIRYPPPHCGPFVVAYGMAELPELQRQSRDGAATWRAAGLPAETLALHGEDHFSILEALARRDGALALQVARLSLD
jgi:arylformamidase